MTRDRLVRRAPVLAAVVAVLAVVVTPSAPALATPGPATAPQYYFDQWGVPALWATGARGQGVVIAELDTGVNAAVPELTARLLPGTDLGSLGGNGQVDRDTDQFGHGTAMASIMVASAGTFDVTGLAPDAQVLPVALPLVGTADAGGDDQLPTAIRYAADHGARIISMSLGETRKPSTDPVPCPASEQEAVFYALAKGAVLVAAAGNQGDSGSPVVDPGVCLGVVSVGAVDRNGAVPSFSSRHPYLTVTAPGVAIASLSRVPGSAYSGDGTSQATAIVSAALALGWSAHPELTGPQLVARLLATVTPPPGTTLGAHDDAYGYGTLATDRLVTASVAADAPNVVAAAAAPFVARYTAGLSALSAPLPTDVAAAPTTAALPTGRASGRFGPTSWLALAVAVGGLAVAVLAGMGRRRIGRRVPVIAATDWVQPVPGYVPAPVDPAGHDPGGHDSAEDVPPHP